MTPDMNWSNTEIDHVGPICLFDVSRDEDLRETFNWKNTMPLSKQVHQQKQLILNFGLQFMKTYQILQINEKENSWEFFWWNIC